MPADYSLESSLFRVKTKVDGVWENDPDVIDPTVELPVTLTSNDPATRLAWRMEYRSGSKVKVKVTFRRDDGTEVSGSFTAYGFVVVPLHPTEVKLNSEGVRPAIEVNPPTVNGTSAEPMILDELGMNDVFGLRFSNISAGDATRMFVRIEEVG